MQILWQLFDQSPAHIMVATLLVLFMILGATDGLYFHIWKYRLHLVAEARLEHRIHAVRGMLFIPVALLIFTVNSGGKLLWLALLLMTADICLEIIDVLVEKQARRNIGGITTVESLMHVLATGFRSAAFAALLVLKPSGAYLLTSPNILPDPYPLGLSLLGGLFALGSAAGAGFQVVTMGVAGLRRGKSWLVSREGISWRQYRFTALAAAAPVALLLEGALWLMRPFMKETVLGLASVPPHAIIYSFHKDALLTLTTDAVTGIKGLGYLSFHGFSGYFPTLHYYLQGLRAIRFDRRLAQSPKQQILLQLQQHRGPLIVRTDSGGPYGIVRGSIVDLAVATGRPVVALAQGAERSVTLASHSVPLFGAQVITRFSAPISASLLASMPRAAATKLLQTVIEELNVSREAAPVHNGMETARS